MHEFTIIEYKHPKKKDDEVVTETDKKIAIYSRKSRFTGKGESIGNQIELCRNHIRNLWGEAALNNIQIFEDEGFSGGNLNRPSFRRMMEAVKKGEFRAIVVYRLDRISRNISDFTTLIDDLTKREVAFLSIREQFDTSTPMGRAMMFIISIFSQLERETIAERIRDNLLELAKTGRWLGGNTPTGYTSESVSKVNVDGKLRKLCRLKLIPEEAAVIRSIFDLYKDMDSITAVESELLRRRVKTKCGKDFSRFAVRSILQNPVYMIADSDAFRYLSAKADCIYAPEEAFDGSRGVMVYNRTDQQKGNTTKYLPMEDWIIAVGDHPGLIPGKQWVQVQESLDRNKNKSYRKPRINTALLTGQIFCACGQRMYPKISHSSARGEGIRYFYVCKGKERSKGTRCSSPNADGNALDAAVIRQIKLLKENAGYFSELLAKSAFLEKGEPEKAVPAADQQARISDNEQKINGLLDTLSIQQNTPAKERILHRIEELLEENRQLQEQMWKADGDTLPELNGHMKMPLCSRWSAFDQIVDSMTVQEKRSAVRELVCRVEWDGKSARLILVGGEDDALV